MGAIPKRVGQPETTAARLMNPTSRVRLPASASQWPLKLQPEKLSSTPSPKGLWIEPFEATLPGSSAPEQQGSAEPLCSSKQINCWTLRHRAEGQNESLPRMGRAVSFFRPGHHCLWSNSESSRERPPGPDPGVDSPLPRPTSPGPVLGLRGPWEARPFLLASSWEPSQTR